MPDQPTTFNGTSQVPQVKPEDIGRLDEALAWVDDTLTRCSIKYMLFGDTAYSIYKNVLPKYFKLSLGIKKQECSEFALNIIKAMVPDIHIETNKIWFTYNGVPVEIRIVHKDYGFLNNPQQVLFKFDVYDLPNPFDEYWKVYRVIQ